MTVHNFIPVLDIKGMSDALIEGCEAAKLVAG